ncbi:MAG: PCMD domain-containing protein [Rikenellaceae bacterium]
MRRYIYITALFVGSLFVGSCIKNDIPYPYQPLYITSIEGDGFTTSINNNTRSVTLTLEETTDIRNVVIDEVSVSEDAKLTREIEGTFDFTSPLLVTLYNYQSYEWSISAEQNITRTMQVVGQIGDAVIDAENNTVNIAISSTIDPANVEVTTLKLGPEGITTMSPTASQLTNFEGGMRQVDVTYHYRTETWRIYTSFEESSVNMTLCSFLATVAWVESSGDTSTGEECGYRYRKVGDDDWTTYTVTPESGKFSAEITGLSPNTDYEIKSYIGGIESASQLHTTEDTPQLKNSDFESWHTASFVLPYLASDTDPVWDSGNQGASLGSATLTEWTTDTRPGSEGQYAAQLTAQKVTVAGIGKFAAGNIFTGSYARTIGMGGAIDFGYPFTDRPLALKGWYKYNCGVIDEKKSSDDLPTEVANIVVGETPDIGTIYVTLFESEGGEDRTITNLGITYNLDANDKSPYFVYTGDYTTFFDPTGDDIIGYGSLEKSVSVDDWTEFEIPIEYYDKERRPTHIMVVVSTSRYGDYFTGSTSSQMWVDDFELIYE